MSAPSLRLVAGGMAWLSLEFLEFVLRQAVEDPALAVTRGAVKPAVGAGENLGSVLLRAIVDYRSAGKDSQQTFIVKSIPTEGIVQQMLEERQFFSKEINMYENTLPAMYKLLEERLPLGSSVQPLAPRFFSSTRRDTLVLEDLCTVGYKMVDRRRGLNLEHCLVALKGLARLHALSVALHAQDPRSMDGFRETMYVENNRTLKAMIEPSLQVLAAEVETWPEYERFGDKIRKICETAVERIIEVMKPDKDTLLVLNHGDFWVNNILFQYSSPKGKVMNAAFVDFQLSRFSSPALDLQYFIHTSPCEVVRAQCVDQMLEAYHGALADTLRTIKCEERLISLDELKSEMESKAFVGLLTSLCVLCVVLAETQSKPVSDDVQNKTPIGNIHSNPRYRQVLQKLLLQFEEKGLL